MLSGERREQLHVVVPVHNGACYLHALVDSLLAQSRPPDRIHIVENGSADASPENFPESVTLTQREEKLGFGAASNIGILNALRESADWVLILNQDLVVEHNACEAVIDAMRGREGFGLIGLSQLSYDGRSLDPPFRGLLPSRAVDDAVLGRLSEVYECEFVPAAAVLVPTSIFQIVGLFDPLIFMYQEDKDLCRRIRNAGYKVGIATGARVRHDCGQHRSEKDRNWRANWIRSRAILHMKWSRRPVGVSLITLAGYALPRFDASEAIEWFRSAVWCLMHLRDFRQRRQCNNCFPLPKVITRNDSRQDVCTAEDARAPSAARQAACRTSVDP